MKTLLTLCLVLLLLNANAQSKALIDSVNRVIGPEYVYSNDTTNGYNADQWVETDLCGDKTKEIIVVASVNTGNDDETHKLFVLARKAKGPVIIDSSRALETDGYPLQTIISGEVLHFSQRFAHGSSGADYAFDKNCTCFLVYNTALSYSDKSKPGNGYIAQVRQQYDVKAQTLTCDLTLSGDRDEKERHKVIKKILPAGTPLRLCKMDSPQEPLGIFINSGPVYNELMRLK